jgi:hypothetical protein
MAAASIVGLMKRFLTLLIVLGLTAGSGATAQAQRTESDNAALVKLVASDGMPSDRFGVSVAVSGDTALVGAPTEDAERGAAYVFTRVDGVWTEEAKLIASDGRSLRKFGYSVALSGDIAVVGGSTGVIGGSDHHADRTPGSAYVFERAGNTWSERAKLTAGRDGATGDDFGTAVAVARDTVLVGAGGVGVGGAAYVFGREGGTWAQQAKLDSGGDASVGDKFGFSVAVAGDTAVVGSQLDDVGSNTDQGSAFVFTRDGARWGLDAKLAASDGAAGDNFGFAVAASADTVVVGAWHDDVNGNQDQGSGYVFARRGMGWVEHHLIAGDGAGGDEFGRSAAVSGDTVLLGAQRDSTGDNVQHGSAYVFGRSGGMWIEQTKLLAPDGGRFDVFGVSVAMSRATALIGAGFHNLHRGAVYLWEDPTTCGRQCRSHAASSPTTASRATTSPSTTPVLPSVR